MPSTSIPGAASAPVLDAHLAVPPQGAGPWPGVVVVHEMFGLNDDIRQIADRFAHAGYVTVAPDLYTAGGAVRCLRATFRALARGEGPAVADIEAARRWLLGRADCTGRVGVAGFCMGGGFALLGATRGFQASSSSYGPLPRDAEQALSGACPVVGSYGGRDRGLRGATATLTSALEASGVEHDIKEYPEAGHSFMNRHNTGPFHAVMQVAGLAFHQPSAEDAWSRILSFFHEHLREPGQGEQR